MTGHPDDEPGRREGAGQTREVVVPDLQSAPPVNVLTVVEEILLTLRGWEADAALDPDDELQLPAPFADGRALAAAHRVQDALRGTQDIDPGQRGGLYGPGGRYEHTPLTIVSVEVVDVEDLAAVAAGIGSPTVVEAVQDATEAITAAYRTTRTDVAEQLARLTGLLDLAWSTEAELLAPRIRATAQKTTVWPTDEEEAAYQRLVTRLNTMATGSAVDRWLY